MKKFLTVFTAMILALLCFALVACNDDKGLKESNVIGTYELVSVSMNYGEESAEYDKEALEKENVSMTIKLNKDKTATLYIQEDDYSLTQNGTWKINGKRVAITIAEDEQDFTYSKGTLSWSLTQTTGDHTMTSYYEFKKVSSTTSEPTTSESTTTTNDFVGEWNATKVLENDVDVTESYFKGISSVVLAINSDGTFSLTYTSTTTSHSVSGTYTITDGTINLTAEDETIPATIDANGKLNLTQTTTNNDVTTTNVMIFTK